jgi:uncharacterized protein YjbI with pentapeptide repeats
MKKKYTTKSNFEKIANSPIGVNINFDEIPAITFAAKNIADSTLTGKITDKHLFKKLNIIHSVLNDVKSKVVIFFAVDFKDCSVRNTTFEKCNFDSAAHINNNIYDSNFIKCTFNLTSITDSEFFNVTFKNCDFTNTVISTCRFTNCKFVKCKISNKLIESSLIFDSSFVEMDVQPEMIIENFGLDFTMFNKCRIKVPGQNKKGWITPEELNSNYISFSLSEIEFFILKYFLKPTILLDGDDNVDATFEYANWLRLSKNPNRFRLLIERYHEFIMYNYEKNEAPFWMILKMHQMTNDLASGIDSKKIDLYRSIMGVHMSLARLVEEYLKLLNNQLDRCLREGKIILLANGPIDSQYYYNEIPEIFENRTLQIEKVIKHNSPNELHILWEKVNDLLPLISVFLATRIKIGLQRLSFNEAVSEPIPFVPNSNKNTENVINALDIVRTELGFDKQVNNYMFKLRAILPGNLLLSLHIELRTKVLGKIKKIITDIIPKDQSVK